MARRKWSALAVVLSLGCAGRTRHAPAPGCEWVYNDFARPGHEGRPVPVYVCGARR